MKEEASSTPDEKAGAEVHTEVERAGNLLDEDCAKLDPTFERALAEEGLEEDVKAWPVY